MPQAPQTVFGAFKATFHAIFTDSAVLMVMIGAVVLYSFFYPLAYQEQVAANQPIMVVDHDASNLSRELIRHIQSLRAVHVVAVVKDSNLAIEAMRSMKIQGYVEIDHGFERDIYRTVPGQVALFANGAWLGRASTVLNALADAITSFAEQTALKQAAFTGAGLRPALNLVARPLFNTQEGYGSSLVTGVAELIIQQTMLVGLAVLVGTRRELYGRVVLSHKQTLGAYLAATFIGTINMLYYVGFVFWYQAYPQAGSLTTVVFSAVLFVMAVVALGLFLTSFFTTRERAYQLILVTTLPLFFLSNLSWPATATPQWLVLLSKLIPSTAGINLMIKTTQFGASWNEARTELINLLGLILLYGGLGWWRYTRQRQEK
ncbi:MAG: ABC transporter permease [Venatoribacter sp.]